MGATSAMYQGPWRELNACVYVDWPAYQGETSFHNVAQRIIDEQKLTPADTIGGSSLGGMVALEIAHILDSPLCLLLGSARNKTEINGILLSLSKISHLTPIHFSQLIASSSGQVGAMFAQSHPEFIRAMCHHLSKWEAPTCPYTNIVRIHGSKDRIIPPPQDYLAIDQGGHLIALSHAAECCALVSNCLIS